MATPHDPLPLDLLGEALGEAATVLRANAVSAGLDAPVPTCPGWTVHDLVAHQGMVHRWATSHVRGAPIDGPGCDSLEQQGLSSPDILGWFDDGATALLQAIVDAPDDLEALAFLENIHSPKHFWTRRQCHETTIHAVDALAARLGRPPRHDETWIKEPIALDGIDELLRGFITRPRMRINPADETSLLVQPDDSDFGWRIALGPDHPVEATVVTQASPAAYDRVYSGHPVELYLQLWNRGTEIDPWWNDLVKVTWR
jgi:uncharacterized protein (TIGR03083 family)